MNSNVDPGLKTTVACFIIIKMITGYAFECYNTSSSFEVDMVLRNVDDYIVSDIQNNHIEYYDPTKKIIRKFFRGKIESYL